VTITPLCTSTGSIVFPWFRLRGANFFFCPGVLGVDGRDSFTEVCDLTDGVDELDLCFGLKLSIARSCRSLNIMQHDSSLCGMLKVFDESGNSEANVNWNVSKRSLSGFFADVSHGLYVGKAA